MASQFVFPFELVEKGSRIALYGAGQVGQQYYKQIVGTNYCDIVYWVDLNYEFNALVNASPPISSVSDIKNDQIDYCVIALLSPKKKDEAHEALAQFMPESKIIWRDPAAGGDINLSDAPQRRERLRLVNLIGENTLETVSDTSEVKREDSLARDKEKKTIKLHFFYAGLQFWNVIKSVAIACSRDKRFDTLVIGCEIDNPPQNHIKRDQCEQIGVRYVGSPEYDMSLERPDVSIAFNIYGRLGLEIRKYSKLVVCITGTVIKYMTSSIDAIYRSLYDDQSITNPDYYMIEKLVYQQLRSAGYDDEKFVCMGNPKFDDIYVAMHSKRVYPKGWEKLKGKKVIMWSTDHNWNRQDVTFDEYAKFILDYFNKNRDIGCIFRPHRVYLYELLRNGVWTRDELEYFRKYFDDSPNLVWDDSPTYNNAYRISDGVLVDIACGMIITSLTIGVPVAGLYRKDGTSVEVEPTVMKALYHIHNEEQLIDFFNHVRSGKDELFEIRQSVIRDSIAYYDGKNGERIKDFIYEKALERSIIQSKSVGKP